MSKFVFIAFFTLGLLFNLHGQNFTLDSLRQQLNSTKVDSQRVSILNEIAFNNISIDPIVAKDDVIIAYNKAVSLQFEQGKARSLAVMGSVYWGFGNYDKALKHYLDALKEYQVLDDTKGRSDCLNNIGEVYKKLGQYNNSLDYLKHSLALKEKLEGVGKPALSYSNLGELYTLMGDYDKAQECYNTSIKAAKEKNDLRVLAYANDGYGALLLELNKVEDAVKYFKESLASRKSMSDVRGVSYVYLNLGKSFIKLSEYDSSEFYLNKSLDYSLKASANDVRARVYKNFATLDSLKGNYNEAYFHFVKHDQLEDSVFNIEKSNQIARMQAEYENEILRKENEKKEAEVSERNTLIIAVIMLLFLTLALANAFYTQRTVQKKANKELSIKNEHIEKQNLEIQTQAIKLKTLNENLEGLNHNLEEGIRKRTKQLEDQNKQLKDYAFIHAHELRAPLANILGLVDLIRHADLSDKDKDTAEHLYTATTQLDKVIQEIVNKEKDKGYLDDQDSLEG